MVDLPPAFGIASSREDFQRRAGAKMPLAAGPGLTPGGEGLGESEQLWV